MTQQTDHVPDKKVTAVEWLKDKIEMGTMCDHINGVEYWDKKTLLEFFEQAKAMERQEQIRFFIAGQLSMEEGKSFEQYYNEAYGK